MLKSKLNAGNTIKAINTWSASLVRYAAGVIGWNQNARGAAMDGQKDKETTDDVWWLTPQVRCR